MSVQAAEHCAAGNPSSRHVRYTTPAETVRLHASLTEWLATDGMSRTLAATLPERGAALWPEEWPEASFEERVALHRNEELASAEEWRDADVIYADPPMCDMVTAAAQTFPAQRVRREEFLAPMGFLFFAKPLPAEAFGPTGVDIPPISAISWACVEDGVAAFSWIRRRPGAYDFDGIRISMAAMQPAHPYHLLWDAPATRGLHNVSLLRSMSALSRQPLTREDSPKIHQSVRGIARRSGLRPEQFRRISLRRPEAAPFELAAARAVAEGRTPAGHWVRGHWRQQRYSTVDEYRPIWIEGFPRGDFSRPSPAGQKLLIARGDRPAVRRG